MPGTVPVAQRRATAEEVVLRLVGQARVRTSDLMENAPRHGLTPAEVREVVWELLDDGSLELTPDRHLTVHHDR